jgi:hypothetical protein
MRDPLYYLKHAYTWPFWKSCAEALDSLSQFNSRILTSISEHIPTDRKVSHIYFQGM